MEGTAVLDKNKITDKLKRFAITFAIIVAVQLVLAGTAATAAWWSASADLVSNSMDRIAGIVDTVSNTADNIDAPAGAAGLLSDPSAAADAGIR